MAPHSSTGATRAIGIDRSVWLGSQRRAQAANTGAVATRAQLQEALGDRLFTLSQDSRNIRRLLKLPSQVGDSVTVETVGYDAGTELNTEDFADMVPPCQDLIGVSSGEPGTGASNPALAEGGVIAHHAGIMGGADLVPSVHGWDVNAPVARITVAATG